MHRTRRNRKMVIFSLLGVLLLISVGYAAFSSSFKIKGSSKITSNWDVRITSVVKGTFSGSAEEATVGGAKVDPQCSETGTPKLCENGLNVSINVDLYQSGDAAEYDITVSNKGDLDAKLNDVIVDDANSSEALLITVTGYAPGQKLYKNGSPDSSRVIHVKIEYNPDYEGGPTSGEINLNFSYVQDDGEDTPSVYRTVTYDYQTNGGSKENETVSYGVNKNVDLSLTDDTREGYTFVGWNTYKSAKEGLSTYVMPNNDVTLYAIYSRTVNITYTKDSRIETIGKNSDTCIMYNNSSSCSVTLPSITPIEGYTTDGWYDGHTKVGNENKKYNASDNVTLTAKAEVPTKYTVTFNPDGGEVTPLTIEVPYEEAIGEMPVPTKDGYVFGGWYISETEEIDEDYVPEDNIEVTAKWFTSDIVAVMDGVGYTSLSSAIDNVQTGNVTKTIKLLKDISETKTISSGKNIILNMNGHSITRSDGNRIFINNGTLVIKNGSFSRTGSTNVIQNNSVMKIINCNITSSANSGAIDNVDAGADMEIIDTRVEMTGARQAIYNNGGKLTIKGNSYLSNVKDRAALHNLNNGNVTIESGTIISTSTIGAVYNQSGTVTIGTKDGLIDNDNIVIQSSSYGVAASGNVNFYDGVIKGILGALNNSSDTVFTEIEDESEIINDIEVIDGSTYKTMYLNPNGEKYTVTFNPNGGEVSIQSKQVIDGQRIGGLPVPTRDLYNFVGWYTGLSDGVEVTSTYTVNKDITIYARWEKRPTYLITFETDGGSSVDDLEIEQGSAIETLPKPTKEGLYFDGWFLEDTFKTKVKNGYVPDDNITLYAKWSDSTFHTVFEHEGECIFNGSSSNITGSECQEYADKKYIDTGISLYSEENIDKDYEVSFEIVNYDETKNGNQSTLFNTKNEANGYPGLVFRKKNNIQFELASRKTSSANESILFTSNDIITLSIYRIDGEIYYSLNGGDKVFVNDLTEFNPTFDLTAWFGAAPTDGTATKAQRYFVGTLKNMYIKLGTYQEPNTYRITYDTNGGNTMSPDHKNVNCGDSIGRLLSPTRSNYIFNGWYTGIESGTLVTSSFVPDGDTTIYARWRSPISYSITFDSNNVSATGTMNNQTVYEASTSKIQTNQYELPGYTFVGWNTKSDGTGTSYLDKDDISLTDNITLYAQWVKNYTITFNKNDVDAVGDSYSIDVVSGIPTTIPDAAFSAYSLTGKEIDSYNSSSDYSGITYYPDSSITVTQDTTLFAHWELSETESNIVYAYHTDYKCVTDDCVTNYGYTKIVTDGVEDYTELSSYQNGKTWFLKYELDGSNVIQNAWACQKFSFIDEPVCLQGGDASYYTANRGILEGLATTFSSNGGCPASDYYSYCTVGDLSVDAFSNGYAYAYNDSSGQGCGVGDNGSGSVYCHE